MSRTEAFRAAFQGGAKGAGWNCRTCHIPFVHGGKRRRLKFGRFTVHTLIRHHRLPRPVVWRMRFTATEVTLVER